jgi:hypothetical protein
VTRKQPEEQEILDVLAAAPHPYTAADVMTAVTQARVDRGASGLAIMGVGSHRFVLRLRFLHADGLVVKLRMDEAVSLGAPPTDDIETVYWAVPDNVQQWATERAGEENP